LDFGQLGLFLPAALLVAASPGANNLLCFTHGIRDGFGPTLFSLIGRSCAFLVLIALVAFGLGPVLEASELVFTLVKWVGVGVLVYLGLKTFFATEVGSDGGPDAQPRSGPALARREFTVALTNPKAGLLFTAFLPQFMSAEPSFTVQLLSLGALYIAIEALAACAYIGLGTVLGQVRMTRSRAVAINRTTGGMLLGAAALLATKQRA
jgi:threonine/homoserine/homoserine lactone efflux protein